MSGIGLVMALGAMLFFSWQAALLLLFCLPVMVVFFVLVGGLTKRRAERQEAALQRVSGSFAERVRILPTLLACHGVEREEGRLAAALNEHEARSRDVLKVAFLNAGVLDFFSSLSIAMLAVFLGLGHLGLAEVPGFHGLTLTQSLSVLVLAPEVFAPLRRFAEAYHAAAEGRAALASLDALALTKEAEDPRLAASREATEGLVLAHAGPMPDLRLPTHGLVTITGPSGCGKTSLLRALAGIDEAPEGRVLTSAGARGWAAADAWLPGGHLFDMVPGPAGVAALTALGLLGEPRFNGGDAVIGVGGADLSGGQRLRLSLARAAAQDARTIYADEPTAKLDAAASERVRGFLRALSRDRLVVVATHDPLLAAQADRQVALAHRMRVAA
jgi:ATP-binding cassette subfamily C protein